MKKSKDKKKILKIRPFNMANFSSGSGYLIFSIFYQAFAFIPATLLVWLLTLVKLPKDEEGKIIPERAAKRFYAITIPLAVIAIIASTILSISLCWGYGNVATYIPVIILVGVFPSLCSFFILRLFHMMVAEGKISIKGAIFASLGCIIGVLVIIFLIALPVNSILEEWDYEHSY